MGERELTERKENSGRRRHTVQNPIKVEFDRQEEMDLRR